MQVIDLRQKKKYHVKKDRIDKSDIIIRIISWKARETNNIEAKDSKEIRQLY